MIENFASYLKCFETNPNQLLIEMGNQQYFKTKGRMPYSSYFIRFALLLRYTSAQAYKLLQEHLPLPSLSLLYKLRKGNLDSTKA